MLQAYILVLKNIFLFLRYIFGDFSIKIKSYILWTELNIYFRFWHSTFKILTLFSSVQFNERNNRLNVFQILFSSTSLVLTIQPSSTVLILSLHLPPSLQLAAISFNCQLHFFTISLNFLLRRRVYRGPRFKVMQYLYC